MVFKYEPMDIDSTAHYNSDSGDDEMDIVEEPIVKHVVDNDFSSNSFLQHSYNKSGKIIDSVSNMFGSFSLNDTNSEPSYSNTSKELQSIASQSPPASPSRSGSPITAMEPFAVDAPVTPTSLPGSPGIVTAPSLENELSVGSPNHHHHHNHYSPRYSPTFVHHESEPIDKTHSHVALIYAVFKLTCYSTVFLVSLYIGYVLFGTIKHDVKLKTSIYESDTLIDQAYCQEQYHFNRCGPKTRVPAVQTLCHGWEKCMMRPFTVGKTKVLAEIMGEAANGFSEALGVKTMIYSVFILCALFWSFTRILKAFLIERPHNPVYPQPDAHKLLQDNSVNNNQH